jgi:hypothetical protein
MADNHVPRDYQEVAAIIHAILQLFPSNRNA